jgi:hypothetical protein
LFKYAEKQAIIVRIVAESEGLRQKNEKKKNVPLSIIVIGHFSIAE